MEDTYRELVRQLSSEDEAERLAAQEAVKAMGAEAIPYLNWVRSQSYYALEALRMLAIIGDDCEGKTKEKLIETMKVKAKKSALTPPEQSAIAQEALERWGVEIPQQEKKVYRCHVCNRPSTVIEVRSCFLCKKHVCADHVVKISNTPNVWFCSEEHKQEALNNPSLLM